MRLCVNVFEGAIAGFGKGGKDQLLGYQLPGINDIVQVSTNCVLAVDQHNILSKL